MQGALAWLKKWGGWIAGIVVAILSFGLIRQRRENERKLKRATLAAVVSEAESRIAVLKEHRAKVVEKLDEDHSLVRVIDQKLAANKRAIVESYEGNDELSDEQVEDEFANLGY